MAFRLDRPTDQRTGPPAERTDPQAGQSPAGESTDLDRGEAPPPEVPVPDPAPVRARPLALAAPALAWLPALIAWVGLALPARALLVDADRGLDLVDESFYLLAARPWASSSAFTGVFGWYLGPWMRLMGDDIGRLRVVGVVVVVLAALWLGYCAGVAAGRVAGRPLPSPMQWLVLPAVAAAALCQYLLFVRTPGYGWFASTGLLLTAAGVVLLLADLDPGPSWREVSLVLSLGLGLAVCAVGKLSTAAGASVLVLLASALSSWRRPAFLRLVATAGVLVALLAVHLTVVSDPRTTLTALRRGAAVAGVLDPHYYTLSGMPSATAEGVRRVLTLGGSRLWVLAFLPILGVAVSRIPLGPQRLRRTWPVLLALPGLVVPIVRLAQEYDRGGAVTGGEARPLLVALATAVVLALVRARWRAALAGIVLLALALCFPLGTNNDYLLWMTSSLAVLAVGSLLCLSAAVPGPRGFPLVAVLALACVGTSAIVIPAVRERAPHWMLPMERETVPVAVIPGTSPMLVDPTTAAWVEGLRQGAAAGGWQRGTPLLDLTANTASVLVLDARAPGALLPSFPQWPGRVASARMALSFEDPAVWRRAWILVPQADAPQNGDPIASTDAIVRVLGRRFPDDYRQVLPVSANFPFSRVVLWRPVSPS
jgi:hypothetical protein